MIFALCVYALLMLGIGLFHAGKTGDYREYVIAGGRQGTAVVTLSLLASMIGGSATLGLVGMAGDIGFPAFWWLGVGALGLVLQAWLLSAKVRGLNACTLPDVAGITVGGEARAITALIIAVSWMGVMAAQFTGLGRIFTAMASPEMSVDARIMTAMIGLAVIAYTTLGGQLSVLRTDAVQAVLIFGGVAAACAFLFVRDGADPALWLDRVELINSRFTWKDLLALFFLAGSTFFIGPDIFSRNLTARDGATARKATFISAAGLAVFGVLIVFVGLAARNLADGGEPLAAVVRALPAPLALLLGLGLISALVSSADTCMMSAATVISHDLLRLRSSKATRVFVLVAGLSALGIALWKSDIIGLLLAAYSVYAPGVVPPLFLAIMNHGRRRPQPALWLAAVAAGGLCGFAGGVAGLSALPFVGMGVSLVLAQVSFLLPEARAALAEGKSAGRK